MVYFFLNNAKINNSGNDSSFKVDKNNFLFFFFVILFWLYNIKNVRDKKKRFSCLKYKLTAQAILFNLHLLSQYHKDWNF